MTRLEHSLTDHLSSLTNPRDANSDPNQGTKEVNIRDFFSIFDGNTNLVRKTLLAIFFNVLMIISHCQTDPARNDNRGQPANYWQQQVNFTLDVTLNDKDNSLDGFEKIEYVNNSPDTLKFIWFHIWPNAYKSDRTAFSDQMLLNGDTKFYFAAKEQRGYINRLDFKVSNTTCLVEDHPSYIDVIKVILPTALQPSEKITLTTPFHTQLPYNFSRGGHDGESYQVTQWYPKPAVYDENGWHPMPYLHQGEFYSEFGNFDVRITLPKNYAVAATGELQNEEEKQWLLTRNNFSWEPLKRKIKTKAGSLKTIVEKFPPSSPEVKTLQYIQKDVHDFAWFADKRFIVNHDTCQLIGGKVIDVFSYYTPAEKEIWKNSVTYAKRAIRFYSSAVGEYPYSIVSTVQGPKNFEGGMEYPTITCISPLQSDKELDMVIAHEIGHNWFYGILATNERDHPWMDEGINSYYEHQYIARYYEDTPVEERIIFESFAAEKLDQPIETPSEKFSLVNYDAVAYYKTSEWLRLIEAQVGRNVFDSAMKEYYNSWQFKHPQPDDFRRVLAATAGRNVDSIFQLLTGKGILPNQKRKGTSAGFIFSRKHFDNFLNKHYQNLITVGPTIGGNSYDNFMAGIFLTNVKLPLNKFKFFITPMYAFGSQRFTAIGKLDYSFYPNKAFRKIDLFLNGSTFSNDEFADSTGKKTYLGFQKIVPGIRFTFKEKDPRSSLQRYIQWKTFFINEDELNFSRDTVFNPPGIVTTTKKIKQGRTLNQLLLMVENFRALYPYRGELKVEQANDFVRASFTGNYFFNYPKEGGLNVRFFAGKFFYIGSQTTSKQFATDRFHLNMTGANGYEDYTYSDYFIGRNKFEDLPSQQIMLRDGNFKVRTDLLASKVGKTDNWLMAANFTSSIPNSINPLALLPFKIPLRVFFDLGTYAEAWEKDAEGDRFLYDAGLQLSFLKNTVHIYMPLIYSPVYKEYIQSTLDKEGRFFKKISFTIDISNFSPKKIDWRIPF